MWIGGKYVCVNRINAETIRPMLQSWFALLGSHCILAFAYNRFWWMWYLEFAILSLVTMQFFRALWNYLKVKISSVLRMRLSPHVSNAAHQQPYTFGFCSFVSGVWQALRAENLQLLWFFFRLSCLFTPEQVVELMIQRCVQADHVSVCACQCSRQVLRAHPAETMVDGLPRAASLYAKD